MKNSKFTLKKQEGAARRGEFDTPHGTIQTPVFMNVGTSAAIKGAVSTKDLIDCRCTVELSNTYHLHQCGCAHPWMLSHGKQAPDTGFLQ